MELNISIDIWDKQSIKQGVLQINKFAETLGSKEFLRYVADKCLEEVKKLSVQRINNISEEDESSKELSNYYNTHKVEMGDDYVLIINDTMADLSNVSPETLGNYPNGISVAKIVEFGTGLLGTDDEEFEWVTQYNPNRDYNKGWVYERDGQLHFTRGIEGRFIYHDLLKIVEENIGKWLNEFLEGR